jgi:hypothetical protein
VSGSCPNLQFTLKGYLVKTTAVTTYTKGACRDLKDDKEVDLRGEVSGIKTVTATSMEVKK